MTDEFKGHCPLCSYVSRVPVTSHAVLVCTFVAGMVHGAHPGKLDVCALHLAQVDAALTRLKQGLGLS